MASRADASDWVVSGAEQDGGHQLTAEALDANDNMAVSQVISFWLGTPESGEPRPCATTADGSWLTRCNVEIPNGQLAVVAAVGIDPSARSWRSRG